MELLQAMYIAFIGLPVLYMVLYTVIAAIIWLALALIAINITLGRDAVFIHKLIIFKMGKVPGETFFVIMWSIWPLGMLTWYVFCLYNYIAVKIESIADR